MSGHYSNTCFSCDQLILQTLNFLYIFCSSCFHYIFIPYTFSVITNDFPSSIIKQSTYIDQQPHMFVFP